MTHKKFSFAASETCRNGSFILNTLHTPALNLKARIIWNTVSILQVVVVNETNYLKIVKKNISLKRFMPHYPVLEIGSGSMLFLKLVFERYILSWNDIVVLFNDRKG